MQHAISGLQHVLVCQLTWIELQLNKREQGRAAIIIIIFVIFGGVHATFNRSIITNTTITGGRPALSRMGYGPFAQVCPCSLSAVHSRLTS